MLALAAGLSASPSLAADATEWLQRIYAAGERETYSGTFVYQEGGRTETSRIVRVVDGGNVRERVEVLDGPPREIIRTGDEVRCYSPSTMTLRVEKHIAKLGFPERVLGRPKDLAEHYHIRMGGTERVAGHECQVIILEPKDNLRYGHKLWADVGSGLLVKAQTRNSRNEIIDQIQFTELSVGPAVDRSLLNARLPGDDRRAWQVERVEVGHGSMADRGWTLTNLPPGYRKLADLKRVLPGKAEVGHVVLSDGLSAVSIFFEPLGTRNEPLRLGTSHQGAINIYVRKIDDYSVTVVGEAPPESVKAIAHAVQYRKPSH